MCRLNLRDYLARPKQHSSGDGSSNLSSSPLLSFSPPLHTTPQQVLLSSFWWFPWLAQACWSMLPKSACRRSPPRSLLPRSSLNSTTIFGTFAALFIVFLINLLLHFCSISPLWRWSEKLHFTRCSSPVNCSKNRNFFVTIKNAYEIILCLCAL